MTIRGILLLRELEMTTSDKKSFVSAAARSRVARPPARRSGAAARLCSCGCAVRQGN